MISADELITLENTHDSGVSNKQPLVLVRGEGARLWDEAGRKYIDCTSGHGVANVGYANPAVIKAVTEQVQRLVVCSNNFYNDQRARLLKQLTDIAPPGLTRAFLCNSGTEAVEAALKFARLSTGRTKIVAAMRGFHGRTFGALSATWRKEYRQPFEPLVPGFEFVPYNRLEAMEQVVDQDTAAVILEVVQGEGGVVPGDGEYLRGVQALCRERGALFIVDEVQTGFGRTGRMFACEYYDLRPDLMCLAKAMAGGLPMGAVLIGPRVGELPKKSHGSTFGGNPLACAAALATIQYIASENLPQRAAELGKRFLANLQAIPSPLVREVRGLGLMVGIELKDKVASYLAALAERGVLALPAGATVMRFLPPLVISAEELDIVVERVAEVLT
ncbi:MAG: aspartate aminotransferase family protein [Anaerolineae bacterium]|jgi:acetylornithine/LysW-gamma-L-lysine aminotransferase|nr:aspartate aminotransferase family protein [Anaerolineae bacterium]MDH7472885.1 aspartate aminotransferase family protein [Anaerolineae bacterium]